MTIHVCKYGAACDWSSVTGQTVTTEQVMGGHIYTLCGLWLIATVIMHITLHVQFLCYPCRIGTCTMHDGSNDVHVHVYALRLHVFYCRANATRSATVSVQLTRTSGLPSSHHRPPFIMRPAICVACACHVAPTLPESPQHSWWSVHWVTRKVTSRPRSCLGSCGSLIVSCISRWRSSVWLSYTQWK